MTVLAMKVLSKAKLAPIDDARRLRNHDECQRQPPRIMTGRTVPATQAVRILMGSENALRSLDGRGSSRSPAASLHSVAKPTTVMVLDGSGPSARRPEALFVDRVPNRLFGFE